MAYKDYFLRPTDVKALEEKGKNEIGKILKEKSSSGGGGGVGNIDELLTWGVDSVKRHVFNNRLDTKFLKPTLGDSAGVFGAAMLVA